MRGGENGLAVQAGKIAVDDDLLGFTVFSDVYGVNAFRINFFCNK